MVDEVKYVPTLVRWSENGKVEERTVNIQEGINIQFGQSNEKKYTAIAHNSKNKIPVLNLKKEEAYNMLGVSHAKEDGYRTKDGTYVYILNSEDLKAAQNASANQLTSWIGSGGRFVESGTIQSNDPAKNGGLNIVFKGKNSQGNTSTYDISLFYNPPKK